MTPGVPNDLPSASDAADVVAEPAKALVDGLGRFVEATFGGVAEAVGNGIDATADALLDVNPDAVATLVDVALTVVG